MRTWLSVLALAALLLATQLAAAAPIAKIEACTKPAAPPRFEDETYYELAHRAGSPGALRDALETILSNGTIKHSYSCVWDMLEESDEDPDNPDNVILLYTGESWPKSVRDTGSSTTGWNREHVWPKSHGFPNEGSVAYTDAHHLRACEKRVNSVRNDNDFKEGGDAWCMLPYNNPVNDCDVVGYRTSTTFEVPDKFKGEVARMVFYMEARNQGQDSNTPSLTIVEKSTAQQSQPYLGWLCTLLRWHNDQGVSERELYRNDVIYQWQYNRNPFIDHPEWVNELWSC